MNLLVRSRFLYHIRKPRVLSQNDRSLIEYRKNLKNARRKIHEQAKAYQQKIEDQYLEKHKQQIRKRHFENQCRFRRTIMINSYKFYEDMLKWKKEDEVFEAKLNKFLHEEDLRKINRTRIIKIMQHQSQNYWYHPSIVDERLNQNVIFPEWIANTEYYHKLHLESLSYEALDFHLLHRVTSNEETLKEKNKLLIPLFAQCRQAILTFKRTAEYALSQEHQRILQDIKINQKLNQTEKQQKINEQNQKFDAKVQQLRITQEDPAKKKELLKKKVMELVNVLKLWKQYTTILGLSSAQILKTIIQKQGQPRMKGEEKKILSILKKKAGSEFVDSREEDTDVQQISLQDYLQKIASTQPQMPETGHINTADLDSFLSAVPDAPSADKGINLKSQSNIDLSNVKTQNQAPVDYKTLKMIDTEHLNPSETSTTVEVLKEAYKDDPELIVLLNQIGEVPMNYPKLFQQIWDLTKL